MKRFFTDLRFTYIASSFLHVILLIIFSFITLGTLPVVPEYVTIDFGAPGSGKPGSGPLIAQKEKAIDDKNESIEKKEDNIEKPRVKQEFDEILKKKEQQEKKKEKFERVNQSENLSNNISKNPAGESPIGSSGYSFDWGGRGTRKILRWEKPKFPPGVQKEIDIKIKFTILPDGSVVSPIPLIKADTQLEDAAIQALKTWKFESLRPNQIQFEQQVIITIPYRLE